MLEPGCKYFKSSRSETGEFQDTTVLHQHDVTSTCNVLAATTNPSHVGFLSADPEVRYMSPKHPVIRDMSNVEDCLFSSPSPESYITPLVIRWALRNRTSWQSKLINILSIVWNDARDRNISSPMWTFQSRFIGRKKSLGRRYCTTTTCSLQQLQ